MVCCSTTLCVWYITGMGGTGTAMVNTKPEARAAIGIAIHQPEAADATSLSERAYYAIRERIVRLELAPGAVVNERGLMETLGLGRTPVREALRRLADERLVKVYPRRGMLVSGVDTDDLRGLSEMRLTLEPVAARLAAARATDDERVTIDRFLGELEDLRHARDERVLIDLDQRLHRHVWDCAHNPFLAKALDEHYVLILRIWLLVLGRVERLDDAVLQHRTLLRAVRDADETGAEEAMRAHVMGFERTVRSVL